MTMLDDRDRLLLDTIRALTKANEDNLRLREGLATIAHWRTINISGEYEHGLRDIIRSMTDVAAAALERS